MGWRRVGDDSQELCDLLDYLLDGLKTLKTSIEMGMRLDGKDETKVDSKELWCGGLLRDSTSDEKTIHVKNAKIALRQMKDARSMLSSVSKSLDDAIQTVTSGISNDCRGIGLSHLPDDLLTYIFEMYVEMSVEFNEYVDEKISPQTLASVSKRFRQIALGCSSLWRHVSLPFPRELLSLHGDRCSHPIIHIDTFRDSPPTNLEKFDVIPYSQWRGLRMVYRNEDEGHLYFEHLKSMIQSPLEALENLLIWNENGEYHSEEREIPPSVHLEGDDLDTLSSWQMPNLTRLELRNVVPMGPLHCSLSNVTSFSFGVLHFEDRGDMSLDAFRRLLESMPKIQDLQVTLADVTEIFDDALPAPPTLPHLTSFELEIRGSTSIDVVYRVMTLLNTKELTHLALRLFAYEPSNKESENLFIAWLLAIFANRPSPTHDESIPFVKLEDFSLEVQRVRGDRKAFHLMLCAMPNVQSISLNLPRDNELFFEKEMKSKGAFRRLRSLRIKLPQACPDDFTAQLIYLNDFLRDGHYKELEMLEIEFRRQRSAAPSKARLFKMLGDKLRWIEY
ncbi:hypothetical protein SCHPADRAFT_1001230 [Schizopora paradoxa]|uniref:F-box domain-containing protein n=1 Tax=Schizopora paradoxa TaxID=27342 RepID=A0A0H2RT48_9AGAM|nr:hypothetical protein SCHPADRAFT_1001230 [Schizopora paradoxa]